MSIDSLTEKLHHLAQRLQQGELQAAEITEMNTLARQLYERCVVLQFKAFEEQVQAEQPASLTANQADAPGIPQPEAKAAAAPKPAPEPAPVQAAPAEPAPGPEPEPEPAPAPESADEIPAEESSVVEEPIERPAFRFSAKPAASSPAASSAPDVSPNQISLIDSIEEISRMEKSINDKFKDAESKTLAERLKLKPIDNLKTAIGINMRFQFTSVLFENDAEAYNAAIDKLNGFTSFLEADDYIQNQLKERFDWQMRSPEVKELLQLVERRYL